MNIVWLAGGLLVGCFLGAQNPVQSSSFVKEAGVESSLMVQRWAQMRHITQLLQTDEGVAALLREAPEVDQNYSNRSLFVDYVRKWRARIPVLPERMEQENRNQFSWDISDQGDQQRIYLTIYHQKPQDTFTIMRTSWREGGVVDLYFIWGIANPYASSGRQLDSFQDSWNSWRSRRR